MAKGDNAGNLYFALFPQCFHPTKDISNHFFVTFKLPSANAFNVGKSMLFIPFGTICHLKSQWCSDPKPRGPRVTVNFLIVI